MSCFSLRHVVNISSLTGVDSDVPGLLVSLWLDLQLVGGARLQVFQQAGENQRPAAVPCESRPLRRYVAPARPLTLRCRVLRHHWEGAVLSQSAESQSHRIQTRHQIWQGDAAGNRSCTAHILTGRAKLKVKLIWSVLVLFRINLQIISSKVWNTEQKGQRIRRSWMREKPAAWNNKPLQSAGNRSPTNKTRTLMLLFCKDPKVPRSKFLPLKEDVWYNQDNV